MSKRLRKTSKLDEDTSDLSGSANDLREKSKGQKRQKSLAFVEASAPIIRPVTESMPLVSNPKNASPIFVHSSFRTSSTWLWSKLRRSPNTLAYYEIFNETLAILERKKMWELNYSAWESKHSPSAPYFLEYLAVSRTTQGVDNYDRTMAFESFVPFDGLRGHLQTNEKLYIEGLINSAYSNNKIPILTCTRMLGRIHAVRKAFNGTTILLHRNLFHQWASYSSLACSGNTYFIQTVNRILAASRHDPFLRELDDWFSSRVESPDDEQMFLTFLLMHLYLYGHAFDRADIVVDATALASDRNLRESIESALSNLIYSEIDLSDARSEFEYASLQVDSRIHFVDTIEQFTKIIIGTCLSRESAVFVEQLKNQALSEWDRHEFFTRRRRIVQTAKNDELNKLLEERAAVAAALTSERDGLVAQLTEATIARDGLMQSLATLTSERDWLVAQLTEAASVRDGLLQSLATLTSERDGLVAQLAKAMSAGETT